MQWEHCQGQDEGIGHECQVCYSQLPDNLEEILLKKVRSSAKFGWLIID